MTTSKATTISSAKVSIPCQTETKVIEVNLGELQNKEIVKVDCIYPDLSTQASHAMRGIENTKNSMLNTIFRMLAFGGHQIIYDQIDAICNYLTTKKELIGDDEKIDIKEFNDIINNVFAMGEAAKDLLSLYVDRERLKTDVQYLEYAQKGVLI